MPPLSTGPLRRRCLERGTGNERKSHENLTSAFRCVAQQEIIDREAGKVVSWFGRVGQLPGEFNQIHGIAADSKGNIFLAENRGRRVLKFHPVAQ
jgi:hypothetical protein